MLGVGALLFLSYARQMVPPKDDHRGTEEAITAVAPRYEATPDPDQACVLTVIEGPDKGLQLAIDGTLPAPVLLGQSPVCTLRLSDSQVSRRHAAIDVTAGRIRITDLGSTNGTLVDGVSIVDAYLRGGEVVRIGATTLQVERVTPPPVAQLQQAKSFGRMVGASSAMRRLYPLIERLARSDVSVIIEGETGTGKEILAEVMHEASPRAAGPYVVFDCTAVAPRLIESELFGHERGAFTGAVTMRKGLFEQADGGTLFIDEIGELDTALQPKLLRAIERSEIRRVGSNQSIRINIRILAATRRNLDREVQEGRFRSDLFHRLAVGRIELPPLHRRQGDVALLAEHFWAELGGVQQRFPNELLLRWESYAWPGNVRELRNAVVRQLAFGDLVNSGALLAELDYALAAVEGGPRSGSSDPGDDFIAQVLALHLPLPLARLRVVDEFERRYIAQALADNSGNVSRAAEKSGIARRYFQVLRERRKR